MNYWHGGQFLANHPGLGMLVSGFVTLLIFQYSVTCGFILVLFTLIMAGAWIYKVMHSQHSLTRAGILWVVSLASRSRTQGSTPPSTEQPGYWTEPPKTSPGSGRLNVPPAYAQGYMPQPLGSAGQPQVPYQEQANTLPQLGFPGQSSQVTDMRLPGQPPQMQPDTPPSQVMQPPTQTSRGSGRMFVPPPIDQERQ